MFNALNYKKKHFHYLSNNDYPIRMDTMPIATSDAYYKKFIEQILSKKIVLENPNYRLVKLRRDNRHISKF